MSFIPPDAETDRLFNNADSFAMVFDQAWKQLIQSGQAPESTEERLQTVLDTVKEHPFLIGSPEMAKQVATFRIRLLDLS